MTIQASITADRLQQTVTETCRAVRRAFGCDFAGIRARPFESRSFSGARIELQATADLPHIDDAFDFPAVRGSIVADFHVSGRTLNLLLVNDA